MAGPGKAGSGWAVRASPGAIVGDLPENKASRLERPEAMETNFSRGRDGRAP